MVRVRLSSFGGWRGSRWWGLRQNVLHGLSPSGLRLCIGTHRNYSSRKTHGPLALVSKFAMENRFVKSPVTFFCPKSLVPLIGPNQSFPLIKNDHFAGITGNAGPTKWRRLERPRPRHPREATHSTDDVRSGGIVSSAVPAAHADFTARRCSSASSRTTHFNWSRCNFWR